MIGVEVFLTTYNIDDIEDALSMFIDYLRDGDEADKRRAKRVERTYNDLYRQVKWN